MAYYFWTTLYVDFRKFATDGQNNPLKLQLWQLLQSRLRMGMGMLPVGCSRKIALFYYVSCRSWQHNPIDETTRRRSCQWNVAKVFSAVPGTTRSCCRCLMPLNLQAILLSAAKPFLLPQPRSGITVSRSVVPASSQSFPFPANRSFCC